jgi:hypothetical protein
MEISQSIKTYKIIKALALLLHLNKNMKKIGILFFAFACLAGVGCYYDTQEALYGLPQNVPCDTTNITFSGKILPIINLHCSSCHSSTTSQYGEGIVLDNFDDFQKQVRAGKLMDDINQNPGSNPMPKDGTKLNSCDIGTIQFWVNKGTPNN